MLARQLLACRYRFTPTPVYRTKVSTTHFGFQTVDEEEKQKKVNDVFDNVADKYDLMNDCMSFGIHRFWKDNFVKEIRPTHNLSYLDVAGGTGDIAFRINNLSRPPQHQITSSTTEDTPTAPKITLCDINASMISVGKARAEQSGLTNSMFFFVGVKNLSYAVTWVEGNAERLPFPSESFDVYTIAFGIRNCTHIEKVLSEAERVLKPYGRFYCLEFSHVDNSVLRRLYDMYSMQLIPVMGQLIAGDWNSYQYLVESIRRFPDQAQFSELIRQAGFTFVNAVNYSGGIAAVHSGCKMSKSSASLSTRK